MRADRPAVTLVAGRNLDGHDHLAVQRLATTLLPEQPALAGSMATFDILKVWSCLRIDRLGFAQVAVGENS